MSDVARAIEQLADEKLMIVTFRHPLEKTLATKYNLVRDIICLFAVVPGRSRRSSTLETYVDDIILEHLAPWRTAEELEALEAVAEAAKNLDRATLCRAFYSDDLEVSALDRFLTALSRLREVRSK